MDSYALARAGKLKLKGDKTFKRKRSKHHSHSKSSSNQPSDPRLADASLHGGWWGISKLEDVADSVAIEFVNWSVSSNESGTCYLSACDDGLLQVGEPHCVGEPPSPQEIFTLVKLSEQKVALKSGYGKYLGIAASDDVLVAIADAIGPREHLEPVFQDNRTALLACFNNHFLSIDSSSSSRQLAWRSDKAEADEMIIIRSNVDLIKDPLLSLPEEERAGLDKAELNYVKKFQSWQDKKLRLSREEKGALRVAHKQGQLHQCLLDRREKMKSDRYCK